MNKKLSCAAIFVGASALFWMCYTFLTYPVEVTHAPYLTQSIRVADDLSVTPHRDILSTADFMRSGLPFGSDELISSIANTVQEDTTALRIYNPVGGRSFSVHATLTDEVVLQGAYNALTNSIQFVVPSYELSIADFDFTSPRIVVAEVSEVNPEDLIMQETLLVRAEDYRTSRTVAELASYEIEFAHSTSTAVSHNTGTSTKVAYIQHLLKKGDDMLLITNVHLERGESLLRIKETSINLLASENFSFESGMWRDEVSDCAVKTSGDPLGLHMAMRYDSTDGDMSLVLASENHPACTSASLRAELFAGMQYGLQVDYRVLQGSRAQMYYKLHDSETERSKIVTASSSAWETITMPLTPEKNTDGLMVFLYASPIDYQKSEVLYDNVRIAPWYPTIFKNANFVFAEENSVATTSAAVTYQVRSPWRWRVHIEGLTSSALLVMPREYSNASRARVNGIAFKQNTHTSVNNYADAWYVDAALWCSAQKQCVQHDDGSYALDIDIEYKQQQLFYGGLIGSVVLLIGLILYGVGNGIALLVRGRISVPTLTSKAYKKYVMKTVLHRWYIQYQLHLSRKVTGYHYALRDNFLKYRMYGVLMAAFVATLMGGADAGFLWAIFLVFVVRRFSPHILTAGALGMLVIAVLLLAGNLHGAAEQLAVYAYVFFAMSVILHVLGRWEK